MVAVTALKDMIVPLHLHSTHFVHVGGEEEAAYVSQSHRTRKPGRLALELQSLPIRSGLEGAMVGSRPLQ